MILYQNIIAMQLIKIVFSIVFVLIGTIVIYLLVNPWIDLGSYFPFLNNSLDYAPQDIYYRAAKGEEPEDVYTVYYLEAENLGVKTFTDKGSMWLTIYDTKEFDEAKFQVTFNPEVMQMVLDTFFLQAHTDIDGVTTYLPIDQKCNYFKLMLLQDFLEYKNDAGDLVIEKFACVDTLPQQVEKSEIPRL